MVTTVTDNSPQSINTSLFAMDSEIQKVKKITESFDEKLSGIDIETGVLSVNGKQGVVELTASDVDALPSSTVIPTTTSELENTSGFITSSGSITGNAATATKATQDASGNVITDTYATKAELDNKSDIGHMHSAADITSGTLPIERGGTGASNGQDAFDNIVSGVRTSSNPEDNETMLIKSSSWYKTTVSSFWEYIKGKISSVLGLTASNYGGKANTAGTADIATKAIQDGNGNVITSTYAKKGEVGVPQVVHFNTSNSAGSYELVHFGYRSAFRCVISGTCGNYSESKIIDVIASSASVPQSNTLGNTTIGPQGNFSFDGGSWMSSYMYWNKPPTEEGVYYTVVLIPYSENNVDLVI